MGATNNLQPTFVFNDNQQRETMLTHLNTLRKNNQFCDVILEVGRHEVPAHRAVLACASQYLFDLFAQEESNNLIHCKLGGIEYEIFEKLVTYAYTARLEIPECDVNSVYKTAKILKMGKAVEACSGYLADHLTMNNCLGIRSIASDDIKLAIKADNLIQQHVNEIERAAEFLALPKIQVDVIGAEEHLLTSSNEKHLCQLVVDWIKTKVGDTQNLTNVTDRVSVLYLNTDNTLRDFNDVDDVPIINTEKIQDYKKLCKKTQVTPSKSKERCKSNGNPRQQKIVPGRISPPPEQEWKVIAAAEMLEKRILCIGILDDTVVAITIHLRHADDIANGSSQSARSSPLGSPRASKCMEKQMSLNVLDSMETARCSVGAAVLDNKIYAVGGYDRGECLNSVESYNMDTNKWAPVPSLITPRGRFDACQLQGKLYACGGSDGMHELRSAECFDPEIQKWYPIANMLKQRSSPGVVAVKDQLYCIGGWSGLTGSNTCEVYNPDTNKWKYISKMNVGRSQAGVCAMGNKIYAVGGCDSWNCLNSVEVYDTATDKWSLTTPLNVHRRGAGVAVFQGKLYVVGGSDGNSSLNTIEIYDPENENWSFGPSLTTSRANVGVAVIHNRLFAIGGFNGSVFLDSIEYLDPDINEWTCYIPMDMGNGSDSDR